MSGKGPLITLLAGLAAGAAMLAVSFVAATEPAEEQARPAASDVVGGTPPPATAPKVELKATYAGRVSGGTAPTLAISVHNGTAIAYLCDGARVEAWYSGSGTAGKLTLSGPDGKLTGTYAGGKAAGTVVANGREWTFATTTVKAPGGLYRASLTVENATVVAGWIRLDDGTVTGLLRRDGVAETAPDLRPDGTVVIDGRTITPETL